MKQTRRWGRRGRWLASLVLLLGCTTARPVLEWRDPDYRGAGFGSILVVGVADQESARRVFEDLFVTRLKEAGGHAVACYAAIPGEGRPDEETIRGAIRDGRFDAVLLTHLVGVEEREVYHPPVYGGGFYWRYGFAQGYVLEPGYTSREKTVKLETSLYDTKTEKLVWSMQSATMNPGSKQKLIEAQIRTVVRRLKAQQLLGGR